jgi:hypothetical protein
MTNPLHGWTLGERTLGTRIVESEHMTETIEDWTKVRSPGRARRRMKQGHKQRIEYHTVPRRDVISIDGGRTLVCHPALMREIGKALSYSMEKRMDALLTQSIFGGQETPAMHADRITRELFARLRRK